MSLKKFLEHMKSNDTRSMKLLIISSCVIMVLVSLCFKIEKIRGAQVKQQHEQLQAFQKASQIQVEYEKNKDALDSGILKKVLEKNSIEVYQARLLKMLESHHIQIQNITVIKGVQKDKQLAKVNEYETTWIGSWKDVMNALKTIETEPIAINFSSIKIESGDDKETVKASIKYKIYIVD